MTPQELFDNFQLACAKYHLLVGGTLDYSTINLMVDYYIDEVSNTIIISGWRYSSREPTIAELEVIALSDLEDIRLIVNEIAFVKTNPCVLFTNNKDQLIPYAVNGSLIYDGVALCCFKDGVWIDL